METMNVMNMCIAAMLKGLKRKLERGDELTVSDRRYLIRCLPTTPPMLTLPQKGDRK